MDDNQEHQEETISEPIQRIAMTKRKYNDQFGYVDEFSVDIQGKHLDECKQIFDNIVTEHNFISTEEKKYDRRPNPDN